MMPSRINKFSFLTYQFSLLYSVLAFMVWDAVALGGQYTQLILGVLLGQMIGVPVPYGWPDPYVTEQLPPTYQ